MAAFLLVAASLQSRADDSFQFRLSLGPRLVGTRAMSSGSGEVSATLSGNMLSVDWDGFPQI